MSTRTCFQVRQLITVRGESEEVGQKQVESLFSTSCLHPCGEGQRGRGQNINANKEALSVSVIA